MRTGATRRRFLRLLAGAPALGVALPAGVARAQERALAIHDATSNTLLGAVGSTIRRWLESPDPVKEWPGHARIALPQPDRTPALPLARALDAFEPAAAFGGGALPLATVSRLLHFTNGVTGRIGGIALRAAPSAGALYAGEVYLVAERVEGLAPGVYAFAPLEHRLVTLREGAALGAVARALEEPARASGAAAAVLLTNVFARYEQRYAGRGYRYALIDSGHQGENLRLTAASAGLATWDPLRFEDEPLNALLGVDGIEEAVCAVHCVGARADAERLAGNELQAGLRERAALVEAHRTGSPLPDAADDDTERYHVATRLVRSAALAPAVAEPAPAAAPAASDAEPQALPTGPAPSMSVEEAIARRRSAMQFTPTPVAAEALGFVLSAAAGHPALQRTPGVSLRLFAHRVDGLSPGLYAADASSRTLRALRRDDLADALMNACLRQEKAAEAAAAFAMVADLERMADARGERAYRDLLLESGGIGQRIYLAAEASGLAARNLAAYLDERLNELARLDGREQAIVHLTLLGVGD